MNHEEIVIKFCIKGSQVQVTKQEFELIRSEMTPNSEIEEVVLEVVARNIDEPKLITSPRFELKNIFKEVGLECLWYRGNNGMPETFPFLQPVVVQKDGELPDCKKLLSANN